MPIAIIGTIFSAISPGAERRNSVDDAGETVASQYFFKKTVPPSIE
jgi:hypothetical protein